MLREGRKVGMEEGKGERRERGGIFRREREGGGRGEWREVQLKINELVVSMKRSDKAEGGHNKEGWSIGR